MTREHKLALIIGFSLVLVVGVLISDHFSKARTQQVASEITAGAGQSFGAGTGGLHVVSAPAIGPAGQMASGTSTSLIPPAPLPRMAEPVRAADAENFANSLVMGSRPLTAENAAAALLGNNQPALVGTTTTRVPREEAGGGGVRPVQPSTDTLAALPVSVPERVEMPEVTAPTPAPAPVAAGAGRFEVVNGIQVPLARMKRHDVKEGESIYRIAQEIYGDGSLWPKLAECNKGKMGSGGSVRVGVTLLLPPKEALLGKPLVPLAEPSYVRAERAVAKVGPGQGRKMADSAKVMPRPETKQDSGTSIAGKSERAEKPVAAAKTYTVQKGDSLSDIAKRTLGSSRRWSEIVDANPRTLNDEDSLVVGTTLTLPGR